MWKKYKRILRKYTEYLLTKIELLWRQRKFESEDVTLKYILKKAKGADTLVVVFSACTRKGLKARYNYMKTLNGLNCDRLYILDDFAADHRGAYYLGSNFRFNEERATRKLIDHVAEQLCPRKIVCCGSSKGGYAAINFGLEIEHSYIIAGAPQYFLTTYLRAGNMDALQHILGGETEEKAQKLEFRLRDKIAAYAGTSHPVIYMHYSDQEHTYEEHVKHMMSDLLKYGYSVEADVADYKNHSDISYYFPEFLRDRVKSIIELDEVSNAEG